MAFAAWWAFLVLIFSFGSCGEDSSFQENEFRRLCGDSGQSFDGRIFSNLTVIGVAAAAATLALGIVALRRRTWWPLGVLIATLITAAGLGWYAEDL